MTDFLRRVWSWLMPTRWKLCRAVRAEVERNREARRDLKAAHDRLTKRSAS